MKTILVVGGAGFVGSHFVDTCLDQGNKVIVYDNFSKGKHSYLSRHKELTIVEGDILDSALFNKVILDFDPDYVYHLAAEHYIPACESRPDFAVRLNIEGTQVVLNAIRGKKSHLVFTSTGAIYNPHIESALEEDSEIQTGDVYGITKVAAEELIKYWVKKHNGKATIIRLFNSVGARETNPHLIPAIMEQLSLGVRRIELGNLYPKRDYVHVKDIAEGLYSIVAANPKYDLNTFNIGSGVEFSVGELVELCGEVINEKIEIVSVEKRRRKFDRKNQLANLDKIKSELNWSPKRNLRQALEEVWNTEINLK